MWLRLTDGIYFFGTGGINRIEEIDTRYVQGEQVYFSTLFINTTKVGATKHTVDELQGMLGTPSAQAANMFGLSKNKND